MVNRNVSLDKLIENGQHRSWSGGNTSRVPGAVHAMNLACFGSFLRTNSL